MSIARGLILALSLGTIACGTTSSDEPIVGCWQRPNEGYSLVFDGSGSASFKLSYEAASAPVSYDFPRIRWRRSGPGYVLRFGGTSLHHPYSAPARIERSQLLVEGFAPLSRADRTTCAGLH